MEGCVVRLSAYTFSLLLSTRPLLIVLSVPKLQSKMFTRTAIRSVRTFSTTPVARKTTVDSIKETADAVNKKVGKGLASAIDKTEVAADKTKEALGVGAKDAKHKVDQAAETTKEKAHVGAAKTNAKTTEVKHKAEDAARR